MYYTYYNVINFASEIALLSFLSIDQSLLIYGSKCY